MKQFLQQISRALVAKLVLVAVCVLAIVGVVAYLSHQMKGSSVEVAHTQRIGVTPTQVERIRSIGQWEFLSVADEEMVDTVRHGFFGDDELSRIYYGTLRLGVDLSQTADGWITMDHDTVDVLLPAIRLLDDNFLDEARTKTFYEEGKWSEADKAALTRRAQLAMRRRCLTPSNIRSAQQNASTQFDNLLKAMGFDYARIRFANPPSTK